MGPGINMEATWQEPTTQTLWETKNTPSWQQHSLMAVVPPAGQFALGHNKTVEEWPQEHDTELKVSTWPPNSPDPNPIKYQWDMPE